MLNIELEKAVELIVESVKETQATEEIELIDAGRRIIAEDIYAPMNNPPFDRSPLDGYALIAQDTKGASRENIKKLVVVDCIFAGGYSERELQRGEAIRIMTGAKIPKGANCVIRQENTDYGEDEVEIYEELREYDNYCFSGEDIKKQDLLIEKGQQLTYVHQGILSSMGVSKVKVKVTPKVGLIVTGDEIGIPGQKLMKGKIYDSNLHLIYSRLKELGIRPVIAEIIEDSPEKVGKRINEVINDMDLIITTGGVSVGQKDILHNVIQLIEANRIFWKVNLKPGTPAMYSLYKNKPILSLSGNPFAALTTFELLGRPLLAKLCGNKNLKPVHVNGIMEDEFNKPSSKRRFIRAYFNNGKVKFFENKHSSGMLASMVGCNCLIDVKKGTKKLSKGDKVDIIIL
ncbi:gephyrin-like molybdotransferase Glp [Clostridium saccharoperbutylacetonicum]|uniref:molybdopterin molybdotransferase MoeA n=1 Tax=Clostridium saccharoperbutylacetonicum TaxID=36745 RepID=UPI000983C753|nr:gephyrin-like molybdotransferase Glp [Clostridium saccharoperbutylacetonicum]AQR95438.1 molybdopterin molybdenumtransferase [Clostridium saccharoperbutylacetonicum]NSB31297.1 molybdopterin molybdotransferase [Clostridium saccharoperbutylacetonicum]